MQYKTELHAHTREVSPCADYTAPELAEIYLRAGYQTVVITNHYTQPIIEEFEGSWKEKMDWFISPIRLMKQAVGDRMNVLLGCELRFAENSNDYLIFGLTEAFLYEHPELYRMSLRSFSELAKEHGLLIIQAHPFRNGMKIMKPEYLDGYEVFNGHTTHHGRNFLAETYAEYYGKIKTSGSDFHHPTSQTAGGILTDAPVTNMEQLVALLRSGDYSLICEGAASERDGMKTHPAKRNGKETSL